MMQLDQPDHADEDAIVPCPKEVMQVGLATIIVSVRAPTSITSIQVKHISVRFLCNLSIDFPSPYITPPAANMSTKLEVQ